MPVRIPISESPENIDISMELNTDFEENSPFQGVISETYQRPAESFFQEPQELEGLVNTGRLVQKFLPKQADIDKILKNNTEKCTQRHTFACCNKSKEAGYLVSPYFKDIYLYLAQKSCLALRLQLKRWKY